MTTLTHELYLRLCQARGFIKDCGWIQGTFGDAQDGYCLTGAINRTGRDGLHVVMRRMVALHINDELVEYFNDTKLINRFEAMQVLDFKPSTAMLEQAYGPHYEAVIGLIRQVAHLTQDQLQQVGEVCTPAEHDMQLRAIAAVQRHRHARVVLEDVRAAGPALGSYVCNCTATLDVVAVTQLAWDALNRGELSVTIDDLAPANARFAAVIGLDA